jgi:hypothetical protein
MSKQIGTLTIDGLAYEAERWSDGTVYVCIGSHWYRPIGQEQNFRAA